MYVSRSNHYLKPVFPDQTFIEANVYNLIQDYQPDNASKLWSLLDFHLWYKEFIS
ncbi:MAG: hypothetical protein F6J94_10505 [Moorea sp. SIO1F2]|uniref:hypothetical protein n=1 Tax=Moorena TaxID=1155738 RepID=UPI00130121C2|nr:MULTISPECIES: hypothetical protein [Moorena]NEN98018.1 hypothetical protein [Moorena sp. SIO3I7]NEO49781.1 hypothetical protein [Moorena sp. SIO4A3]NEO60096.1 hypothetical protein [Moorena sp. SIO4G2]NEO06538.1 hypothetical protein [Moorena sp. SIO3I8]NEO19966.1 hypothetical protein [Moorena sp. SIO4A5]